MRSRKRGRQQPGSHQDDEISIIISDDCTLVAQENLVRICSSCAAGLPAAEAGSAEWDLRMLRIEPVDKEIVISWLNCAYDRLQDDLFMEQAYDVRQTVAGLASLLAFADAVDTTRGVLAACVTKIDQLHMLVEFPGLARNRKVTLATDGRVYYFKDYHHEVPYNSGCRHLAWAAASGDFHFVSGTCCPVSANQRLFRQRVAEQVEPLLHLAHKLELQALAYRLHTFISSSTMKDKGILWGMLGAVFSERVLAVAVGDRATVAAKGVWIDRVPPPLPPLNPK